MAIDYSGIEVMVGDSRNQFCQFSLFEEMDYIKDRIKRFPFVTLEVYTKRTREELEALKPGMVDKYNNLLFEFQNPDLTYENFRQIINKVFEITSLDDEVIINPDI